MDLRGSFSRLKKKIKHPESKRKPDRTGVDSDGERLDPAGSLSQPVPVIVGAGHGQGEKGANVDGRQVRSAVQLPQQDESRLIPAGGNETERGGGEASVDGRYSHPRPEVEVAVGSGPGWEGGGASGEKVGHVYPSPPIPSITHGRKPNSMWA